MVLDHKCNDAGKRNRGQAVQKRREVRGGLEIEGVKGGVGRRERGGDESNGVKRRQNVKGVKKGQGKPEIYKDETQKRPTKADTEIAAWSEWLNEAYPTTDYDWYMITLMFNELSGKRDTKFIQMEREADLIYRKLLTRIFRDPSKELYLPLFVLHPDLPVPKKGKNSLENVTINDGWHLSGIFISPKRSRLKGEPLDKHVAANPGLYKNDSGKLRRIHIVPVDRTPKNVVSYCFKTLKRDWIESGNTFIWPKAKSELSKAKPSTRAGHTAIQGSAHIRST